MSIRLVLTTIFAAVVLTGAANAQHIKAFSGATVFLSASNPHVSITAVAGKSIRVKLSRNGSFGTTYTFESPHRSVPCDGSRGISGPGGLTFAATIETVPLQSGSQPGFLWKTDRAWKGTCHVLPVALSDGSVRSLKVRFL